MELPPVRKDGHMFFNNTQNAFYKELIASELKSRQSFTDCTATYRSGRNPILAERTPRDATFRRRGGEATRRSAASVKGDDIEETAGRMRTTATTTGRPRDDDGDGGGETRAGETPALSSFGGLTGPIAEARMVSLEVAKLHRQREDLVSRIREVERLLDYDKRKGARAAN